MQALALALVVIPAYKCAKAALRRLSPPADSATVVRIYKPKKGDKQGARETERRTQPENTGWGIFSCATYSVQCCMAAMCVCQSLFIAVLLGGAGMHAWRRATGCLRGGVRSAALGVCFLEFVLTRGSGGLRPPVVRGNETDAFLESLVHNEEI